MANTIKKYKTPDQYQFVPVGFVNDNIFKGGSYALSLGYTDHEGKIKDKDFPSGQSGRYVEYIKAKNEKNRDIASRFKFDQSLGRLMARATDKDIYGKSLYEFLKNHPECEGSPNGFYEKDSGGRPVQTGVTFRELNTAKDAEVALKAIEQVNEAESSVRTLDEKTLEEIANVIGYFGPVDTMMRLKVFEFARKLPQDYLALMKTADRAYYAIVRKAIAEGIFKTHGKAIKWEALLIGSSEDDAVAFLRNSQNEAVFESLKAEITKRANQ